MSVIDRVVIAVASGIIVLVVFVLGALAAPAQDLGFVAGAVFNRLDRNGDGILSKEEVTSAREQMFDRVDMDRDGIITLAEIGGFVQGLHRGYTYRSVKGPAGNSFATGRWRRPY
jgi:hypothetical protein